MLRSPNPSDLEASFITEATTDSTVSAEVLGWLEAERGEPYFPAQIDAAISGLIKLIEAENASKTEYQIFRPTHELELSWPLERLAEAAVRLRGFADDPELQDGLSPEDKSAFVDGILGVTFVKYRQDDRVWLLHQLGIDEPGQYTED